MGEIAILFGAILPFLLEPIAILSFSVLLLASVLALVYFTKVKND